MRLLRFVALLSLVIAVKSQNEGTFIASQKYPDTPTTSSVNDTVSEVQPRLNSKLENLVTNDENKVPKVANKINGRHGIADSTRYRPGTSLNLGTFGWILAGLGVFGSVCITFGAIFCCCKLICDKDDYEHLVVQTEPVKPASAADAEASRSPKKERRADKKEKSNHEPIQSNSSLEHSEPTTSTQFLIKNEYNEGKKY